MLFPALWNLMSLEGAIAPVFRCLLPRTLPTSLACTWCTMDGEILVYYRCVDLTWRARLKIGKCCQLCLDGKSQVQA